MSNTTEIVIGSTGGILVVICMIPQLYNILKNKSCKDVSINMYVILFIGEALWCVYGVLKHDIQIIVTNVLSCIISILIITMGLVYRTKDSDNIC